MIEENTQPIDNTVAQPPTGNKILDLINAVEDEAKSGEFKYLQNGETLIDFSKLTEFEVITEEYRQADGTMKKTRKLIATIEGDDLSWKLPIVIYKDLKEFVQREIFRIGIVRKGEGLGTRYTLIPETGKK